MAGSPEGDDAVGLAVGLPDADGDGLWARAGTTNAAITTYAVMRPNMTRAVARSCLAGGQNPLLSPSTLTVLRGVEIVAYLARKRLLSLLGG
jgi:hypothetical protein